MIRRDAAALSIAQCSTVQPRPRPTDPGSTFLKNSSAVTNTCTRDHQPEWVEMSKMVFRLKPPPRNLIHTYPNPLAGVG